MMQTDTWLNAAVALRETSPAHKAVTRLAEKTPYETRGSSGTVRSIALRDEGTFVTTQTGLLLDLAHVPNHSVKAIIQDVRAGMVRRWKQLAPTERSPMISTLTISSWSRERIHRMCCDFTAASRWLARGFELQDYFPFIRFESNLIPSPPEVKPVGSGTRSCAQAYWIR